MRQVDSGGVIVVAIKIIEGNKRTVHKSGFRDMIRKDLSNLIKSYDTKVQFEFTGDYNYKYLAKYAREEARRMFIKMVEDIRKNVISEIEREFKTRLYFIDGIDSYLADKFIKIYQRKEDDRIHVYGEFDPNYITSGAYRREYEEALRLKAENRKRR